MGRNGPISYVLMSSGGWLWWDRAGVDRHLWHTNRHYDNEPRTWEELTDGSEGDLHVLYDRNPHYTKLPKIDQNGDMWHIRDQ